MMHQSFDEWTPPTPLLWFELPNDERVVSNWETKSLDVAQLAGMRRPVGVVFAEGRAVEFLEGLGTVQELRKAARAHVERLRVLGGDAVNDSPKVQPWWAWPWRPWQ